MVHFRQHHSLQLHSSIKLSSNHNTMTYLCAIMLQLHDTIIYVLQGKNNSCTYGVNLKIKCNGNFRSKEKGFNDNMLCKEKWVQ